MPDGTPPLEELRASFRRHPQGDAIRQRFAYPVQDERPGGTDGKTMPTPMTTRHILVGHDALLFFYAKEILRAFPRTAAAAHAARRVDVKMMLHRALRMSGDAGASRFSLQNIFRPERFAFPTVRSVVSWKKRGIPRTFERSPALVRRLAPYLSKAKRSRRRQEA